MNENLIELFEEIDQGDVEKEIAPEGFQVKDLKAANWCMTKMAIANTRIAEAQMLRKAFIEKVDIWYENYCHEYEDTLEKMEGFLRPFVGEHIKDSRSKTLKMVNGRAGFRTTPDKIEYLDEDKVVEFAETKNIPVQIKKSVKKNDIKSYIKETGEVPESVQVIPGVEKFYVTVE